MPDSSTLNSHCRLVLSLLVDQLTPLLRIKRSEVTGLPVVTDQLMALAVREVACVLIPLLDFAGSSNFETFDGSTFTLPLWHLFALLVFS